MWVFAIACSQEAAHCVPYALYTTEAASYGWASDMAASDQAGIVIAYLRDAAHCVPCALDTAEALSSSDWEWVAREVDALMLRPVVARHLSLHAS